MVLHPTDRSGRTEKAEQSRGPARPQHAALGTAPPPAHRPESGLWPPESAGWLGPLQAYHNYTIEWTPQWLAWAIDGLIYRNASAADGTGRATSPSPKP